MNQHISIFLVFVLFCSVNLQAQRFERLCAEVRTEKDVPRLFINGELYPPFAYMSYLGEEKFYAEMAGAGLHLYNIPAYLGDRGINSSSGIGPFRPAIWTGNGQYDLSSIKKDFEEILKADPMAKVIIRIHLDPPAWWEKEHPDEVCALPGGGSLRTSFFSRKWQRDAGKALKHCVKTLLNSPYAAHLAGIHVAGGFTEEWFYHFKDEFHDESEVRLASFRDWLRDKYGNKRALRQAWKDSKADFKTAAPANISGAEKEKHWRDAGDQKYFDTFDFHAETMAEHINFFTRIVKKASNGCLLTGAFYGYHYFVTDPRRGHGALAKVLENPYLDYLSSPNDYRRRAGEDWPPMAAIRSVQLHGKLWLAENDTRTSITTLLKDRAPEIDPPGDYYSSGVWHGPEDMQTSKALLLKNLGRMLAYGYGGWWFDMWGGWFSDPELLAVIRQGQEFFKHYPSAAVEEMEPEVAVVVDERLQFWDKSYGSLTRQILGNRYALGKTGAPYDLYLRSDLDKIPAGKYKVVWLMGISDLSQGEQSIIERIHPVLFMHTDNSGTVVHAGQASQPRIFEEKLAWKAESLAELWDQAGVHRYGQAGDIIYAGRGWLVIHSVSGGKKTLRLPFAARVIDPVRNITLADNARIVPLNLEPGDTRMLRVKPE